MLTGQYTQNAFGLNINEIVEKMYHEVATPLQLQCIQSRARRMRNCTQLRGGRSFCELRAAAKALQTSRMVKHSQQP